MSIDINELLIRVRNWDKLAIAKLITLAEEGIEVPLGIQHRSHVIGITGPPGSGKSTLIYTMARKIPQEKRIAILTIDPSSPFTGGSFMGNRIRMQELTSRPNIYIRSMATRGIRGGLNYATIAAVNVLEYAGADYIFIETVGAGQSDTDIKYVADTILVLVPPLSGDEIQALKSGLMEIGDIYVVSKSDNQVSESTYRDLMAMVDMMKEIKGNSWKPIVVKVSGLYGYGVDDLLRLIDDRFRELINNGRLSESLISRRLLEMRLYAYDLLEKSLIERKDLESEVVSGKLTPQEAARRLLGMERPRLDHVAIAVKDLDGTIEKFRKLGLRVSDPVIVEEQGVKVAMVWLGNTRIELLEPLNPNSTVAKFLESRGEGIHHIALEVNDLEEFIKRVQEAGLVITGKPSKGAEGLVVFIHPKSLNGVLLELVQHRA
ncbi:MAG: methylmalonyl Co-A mutase-associated GTPase MeaB [Vulcanisaeta sp.]|jgi:LAO/AO transport system kinase|uniref:Periplasmic protein kinase ArgK and related GTPase of G3E family n=1 Tax=Vulcanisaeta moutnovskia (strain 768-28) TaxID=985053 RepID=F0QX97_VULM7|nr:methylmalonyl Co-A mutase-associated GTPase MeaB [Vulcanisaeta moutnovskia]ADY01136.1 putative periplasmic protein kinase ArgK and related GTPase of G3E family [Vulcanisaeta moutnovskia 768-28]